MYVCMSVVLRICENNGHNRDRIAQGKWIRPITFVPQNFGLVCWRQSAIVNLNVQQQLQQCCTNV